MKRRTLHDEINNEDYYYEKVGGLWYEVDRGEEAEIIMDCKNCIYYTDEQGKHIHGCILFPYKKTLPDDNACERFMEIEKKGGEIMDNLNALGFKFSIGQVVYHKNYI